MTVLEILLAIAVTIGTPLSWLYLREQVKRVVREESQRTLADYKLEQSKMLEDHRHERSKLLEAVRAAEQRRSAEIGLFARERHRAYPRVYRRYRIAADSFSLLLGFYEVPDFRTWKQSDLADYVQRERIPEHYAQPLRSAIDAGDSWRVRDLMSSLDEKVRHRNALEAFNRAKNAETLEDLYLSDAVRRQLTTVRHHIGTFSVAMRRGAAGADAQELEKKAAMEEAVGDLYAIMRTELSAGSSLASPVA